MGDMKIKFGKGFESLVLIFGSRNEQLEQLKYYLIYILTLGGVRRCSKINFLITEQWHTICEYYDNCKSAEMTNVVSYYTHGNLHWVTIWSNPELVRLSTPASSVSVIAPPLLIARRKHCCHRYLCRQLLDSWDFTPDHNLIWSFPDFISIICLVLRKVITQSSCQWEV